MSDSLLQVNNSIPKVFISYSHDDETHKVWVKELAVKLRKNGIDVILDEFSPLGTDLALFMEQGLSESHKVLCICSSLYNEKANAGVSGVNYEKRIISQELMKETSSVWVIPIIKNNNSDEKLPRFLSSIKYISFEDNSLFSKNYYLLLEQLHNRNNIPPIGKNPFDHDSSILGKIDEMNQIKKSLSLTTDHTGKVRFNFIANSGNYIIGTEEYEFRTHWSVSGGNSIHAYNDYVYAIALSSEEISLDKFSIEMFDFSSKTRTSHIGETLIWVNKYGRILFTKIENIQFENTQTSWLELSYQIASVLKPISLSDVNKGENI